MSGQVHMHFWLAFKEKHVFRVLNNKLKSTFYIISALIESHLQFVLIKHFSVDNDDFKKRAIWKGLRNKKEVLIWKMAHFQLEL